MKTSLRVHDGEGDKCLGVSMTCISPTAASAIVQRPGGDGERHRLEPLVCLMKTNRHEWYHRLDRDDSDIDGSTTSVAVIAGKRAHNNNLIHRGCRR
jgi:hypothetical protein